jgi:hypothetical protein
MKSRPDSDNKPAPRPRSPDKSLPAAGPHAKPELTDPAKTPGTGALPEPGAPDADAGTG